MERTYLITQEQLELIEHYKRMFELNADLIKDLCNSEKDDVVLLMLKRPFQTFSWSLMD